VGSDFREERGAPCWPLKFPVGSPATILQSTEVAYCKIRARTSHTVYASPGSVSRSQPSRRSCDPARQKKWSLPSIQTIFSDRQPRSDRSSPVVPEARESEPLTKSFGLPAIPQKAEVVAPAIDWRDRGRGRSRHLPADRDTRPAVRRLLKRKSGENDRQMEFMFQPIQRGANVVHLATPVVVLTVTQAHAAKS